LYRDILRQHRISLPSQIHRDLGDRYVRSEFKAHKDATDEHVEAFMNGWTGYLNQLRQQPDQGRVGKPLSEGEVATLSEEQRGQLLKFRQES
ncbi:unnamed protein product, partial [Choristocarpus tenellus]